MKAGQLILIPTPIADDQTASLSPEVLETVGRLDVFIVERIRTARRFIRLLHAEKNIDNLSFFEVSKGYDLQALENFLSHHLGLGDVGLMSEAGCPGIADPGSYAVRWAHKNSKRVRPLSGPSSIPLALMASGFNGQQFTFHGYLPVKKPELINMLKDLEKTAISKGYTQIFMDAPYRNNFLLEHCCLALDDRTNLCIACNLDAENSFICTQSVKDWKKTETGFLHKQPAIFLIGR